MAPDSKRLEILKALTEHLKGITKANGYDYDLANAVFRGRTLFGENDPVPMLSILEAPVTERSLFAAENKTMRKDTWQLLIQGWVADDTENPTDPVYGLAAAVNARLFDLIEVKGNGKAANPNVYLLGGLIGELEYGPAVVRPPTEQVSSKAFFWLPVWIDLAGNVG